MVESDQRVLVVHHPPFDGLGVPSFDLRRCAANAAEALEGDVTWAPIGPVVRNQLETFENHPPLLAEDWYNILDTTQWHQPRAGFCAEHPVIGRHSRPDDLKWPDDRETILKVYPDRPDVLVRILGGGPYLQELVGPYPKNWQVWSFNEIDPQRFLGMIDFFVYFHHSHWIEAFGRTILEAMASGCVLILPEPMKVLFGEGGLYTDPDDAVDLVQELYRDREAYRRQSELGLEMVKERFGPQVHAQRLTRLIGKPAGSPGVTPFKPPAPVKTPPAPADPPAVVPEKRRRVLFMTSNGIGMGHLARMMAIARRCGERVEPIFLTMSQAISVVRKHGYFAEFLPFHRYLGVNHTDWNKHLREEINTFLAFHEPSVVVFDGNVPYSGLVDAIKDNPEPLYLWCRRAMWRPGHGDDIIKREKHFDGVIEPGELAHAADQGATVRHRGRTVNVPPIRFLDEDDMLSREAAVQELELDPDRPKALILLGAGNNIDVSHIRRIAIEHLVEKHDAEIVIGEWVIAEQEEAPDDSYRRLRSFPFSRYFKAFDLIISAAGYNSFHELAYAGVPVIFVPNETPGTDDQLARSQFAERRGLGMVVRLHELFRVSKAIDHLLDPKQQSLVAERALMQERENGAQQAARLIEEMAFSRRTDRRLVV